METWEGGVVLMVEKDSQLVVNPSSMFWDALHSCKRSRLERSVNSMDAMLE